MALYQLVIFDMDGTLTEERIDFDIIRREIGVAEKSGILEHIRHLEGDARIRAETILHRHEMLAAEACVVHEGAREVLADLRSRGIRTALLTRNSRICTDCVLTRHGLELEHLSTREDEPHKPHADSILKITRRFNISPKQTLMVGDYLYDVQAAKAAGVDSALLCRREPLPDFAALATYHMKTLHEVLRLCSEFGFGVPPSGGSYAQ